MLRNCLWDHKSALYVPASPCEVFYLVPGETVPRIVVPNARGEYTTLVPGLPYHERVLEHPRYLCEFAPPPLRRDVAVQTERGLPVELATLMGSDPLADTR